MGKYTSIIDRLPRMEAPDPAYQERVQAVKDILLTAEGFETTAAALTKEYAGLRREKDKAEEIVSEINLRLEAVSQLLITQFDSEGISKMDLAPVTVEGVAILRPSVSVQLEPYAQVMDKEVFRQWCIAQKLETQMVLPWATTNSLVKARLLEGDPEPDGVIATSRAKIVFRKG